MARVTVTGDPYTAHEAYTIGASGADTEVAVIHYDDDFYNPANWDKLDVLNTLRRAKEVLIAHLSASSH